MGGIGAPRWWGSVGVITCTRMEVDRWAPIHSESGVDWFDWFDWVDWVDWVDWSDWFGLIGLIGLIGSLLASCAALYRHPLARS